MKARLHRLTGLRLGVLAPQPLTAAVAVALAVLVMAGSWTAAVTAMEPELDAIAEESQKLESQICPGC